MKQTKSLYPTVLNPLLIRTERPLPKTVAIIGAGTIGPDIGYYLKSAMPTLRLILIDIAEKPLASAAKRISGYIQKAIDKKKMRPEKADQVASNIMYTTDYSEIRDCDLVIEAATENIPLKQKIFSRIEDIVREDTTITSNTSSIPADRLFSNMKYPGRTTVTHFFAPAWRSLPVEVINWEGADPHTLEYLLWFFAQTGKVPIMTDNAICFVLDRIFDNWCNEAAYLLDAASASQIDKTAETFVFAGPFFVLNMANGNPIIIETNTLQMEEGDHYLPAPILASVDKWSTHRPGAAIEVPDQLKGNIKDRLLAILFSQSFDIVDRGIGTSEDLNLGCRIALGFRKGPFDIMRDQGESEVDRIMDKFKKERPGFPGPVKPFQDYMDFKRFVLMDDMEGIKIITIRRPETLNALNDDVTHEILKVLKEFEHDPAVKGFIITGYGNTAFSAGADIGKFPEMLGDQAAAAQYARDCAKVQLYMDQMEKPVVAAINGLALGGGLEIAIRCHGMVAMKNAALGFPEITLGILPGIGGCVVPYRKWPKGADQFHEMICLGKSIRASQAHDLGMIDQLADNYPDMIRKSIQVVRDLAGNISRIPDGQVDIPHISLPDPSEDVMKGLSREAVELAVHTIQKGAGADTFIQSLEEGYSGFGVSACTESAKEGISAFLEKRKPVFRK